MKKLNLVLLALVLLPICFASQASMPLLAVRETDEGFVGSTAELYLEINDGSGRVFVDTFPLSKIDTQFSMRAAQQIACSLLEKDCDKYDFIYTIRASSPIIGGPSAGAAATVLTIATLTNTEIKEGIAMTGTINSGGLIGPVGGLKEKIKAAADLGLNTVLIPEGEIDKINLSNSSVDLRKYAQNLSINLIEVPDINSAMKIFTGTGLKYFEENFVISDSYTKTMKGLANDLCNRNNELKNMVITNDFNNETKQLYKIALNLSIKGQSAFENNEFYTSASYCFGSNVKFNQVFLNSKNFSDKKYDLLLDELKKSIKDFEAQVEKKQIKTITDLESYMVVEERLSEAFIYANQTKNVSKEYAYAYGNERLRSAYSWMEFFTNSGKVLELDEANLKKSCQDRIAEAEERIQYAGIYIPFELTSTRDELDLAYKDFQNKDYALCLFKASKAKSAANIVLNTLGVGSDYIPTLIDNKLKAAARVIVSAEKKNIFPILGYSYYEYANNLKETDQFSALLYAEYALELSNLDAYFKEKQSISQIKISTDKLFVLIAGIISGFLIGIVFESVRRRKRRTRKPSKTHALLGKKR